MPDDVVNGLLEEASRKDSIRAKDDEELQKTLPSLRRQMKALVARDLWDMSEYFQIINEEDPVVQRGLEAIRKLRGE